LAAIPRSTFVKKQRHRTHYDRFDRVREANDIDNISIDIDVISCFNELTFYGNRIIFTLPRAADELADTCTLWRKA
jgi:hypothetical protein